MNILVRPTDGSAPATHADYQDLTELRRVIRFLEADPLLRGLPVADLETLASKLETRRYRRKQPIWEPGHAATEVFWVRSGVLRISQFTQDGRELSIGLYAKHALVGLGAALSEAPRTDTAVAHDDLTLYAASASYLTSLMRSQPLLAGRIAALLASTQERLHRRMTDLVYKTAHARLASLFLDLADTFGVRDSRGTIVNLKLTHREMATLIGTTRETVSFAIVDLRKDQVIENQGKRVVILDANALKTIAASSG